MPVESSPAESISRRNLGVVTSSKVNVLKVFPSTPRLFVPLATGNKSGSIPIKQPRAFRRANPLSVNPPIDVHFLRADRLVPVVFDPLRAGAIPVAVRAAAIIARIAWSEAVVDRAHGCVAGSVRARCLGDDGEVDAGTRSGSPSLLGNGGQARQARRDGYGDSQRPQGALLIEKCFHDWERLTKPTSA